MDEIDRMMQTQENSNNNCKEVYRNTEGRLSCNLGKTYSRQKCIYGYDDCEDRVKR